MFGYVVMNKPEIKFKDFDMYRSFYCGLCRELKERYGLSGQITLTYDMTFVILLLSGLYEPPTKKGLTRCIVHPVRRQPVRKNAITEYAADMNIFLTYYKCKDDWNDERSILGLAFGKLLERKEKKSEKLWSKKVQTIVSCLDELSELIILDEANIMVRGLSGDAKTIQACISRYLDNLQAKFQVDRRAAEAYFKSRTQMTDSTVQRYTQFDKSLIDDVKEFFQNGTISHAQALSLCPLEPSEQILYVNAINKAIQMSNGDKALEHTYVTRITDRAAQAARMTNGREAELARLEEAIIPPVHAKPAGDVAVRTQKATLIRKYEKVTFDLSKITSSKRRLNSLRKMDAADGDGSIVESLDKLAKEAAELADLLRNGQ